MIEMKYPHAKTCIQSQVLRQPGDLENCSCHVVVLQQHEDTIRKLREGIGLQIAELNVAHKALAHDWHMHGAAAEGRIDRRPHMARLDTVIKAAGRSPEIRMSELIDRLTEIQDTVGVKACKVVQEAINALEKKDRQIERLVAYLKAFHMSRHDCPGSEQCTLAALLQEVR